MKDEGRREGEGGGGGGGGIEEWREGGGESEVGRDK